ncbi:hypothetical protein BDZ89DRAFT_992405 [Hymenopellis radicata]|nr:hypothetical protein BDZ89DRAFT_992405 [Hymenopellis radicata]
MMATSLDMDAINPTSPQLSVVVDKLLQSLFSANVSSNDRLSYFSKSRSVTIQHSYEGCPSPSMYRFTGLNAVRSYFDLIATHYDCTPLRLHSVPIRTRTTEEGTWQTVIQATVLWTWKSSGLTWQEDFTCTLDLDAGLKVASLVILTTSGEDTCLMRAVDPGRKVEFNVHVHR